MVTEPKKILPKMTVVGIPSTFQNDEIINSIREKNPKIREMMDGGSVLTLLFVKDRASDKLVVFKMSPDIRNFIVRAQGYLYVGLSRCRAYDRFWITQCYHCLKFGHIAARCGRKDKDPICGHCSQNHETRRCSNKESVRCANCSDARIPHEQLNHSALSRNCPAFAAQRRILMSNTDFVSSKN